MNKNKQRVWAVGSMSVVAVAISAMAAVPRPARADEKPIAKGPPAPSVVSQTTISPVTATGDSNRLSISSQPKMQASDQQTSTVSVQAVNPVVIAAPVTITPATNQVENSTTSALGRQVIGQLDAKTVGNRVLEAVSAKADVPEKTAILNPETVGSHVISQLQKVNLPTQTTTLHNVDDTQFAAAKVQADAVQQATGQTQVLIRSAAETAEAGSSQTNAFYDPTGTKRAASNLLNKSTMDAYTTPNGSLLGQSSATVNQLVTSDGAVASDVVKPVSWADNISSVMSTLGRTTRAALAGEPDANTTNDTGILKSIQTQILQQVPSSQAISPVESDGPIADIIKAVKSDQNPLSGIITNTTNAVSETLATLGDNNLAAVSPLPSVVAASSNDTLTTILNTVKAWVGLNDPNSPLSQILQSVKRGLDQLLESLTGKVSGVTFDDIKAGISEKVTQAIAGIKVWFQKAGQFITDTIKQVSVGGLDPLSGLQNGLGSLYFGIGSLISSFSPSRIIADLGSLIRWPNSQTLPSALDQLGKTVKQLANFFGLPGISDILKQGNGMATAGGSPIDIWTNIGKLINNSIIGTLIGSITDKQSRAMNQIQWVDPNVTDRDMYLFENGQVTDQKNPNYGQRLFTGITDPKFIAEDTGQSSDEAINAVFGQTINFDVAAMQNVDHAATAPKFGSWELDGPNTMTPDHRYLTSIRNMPITDGVAGLAPNSSVSSMRIIGFQNLGQGTLTSLAASSSEPLKDGFNTRGWAPILAWDSALGYLFGPLFGGTWHSPLVDRANGNYGIWVRIQYPDGVDARSMAMSVDWWSAINMQQYTLTAALGIIPVTLSDWALEWMPRYTGWSVDDPNAVYYLVRGKKSGGADWNKIQNVDNVGGANIKETLNVILHPKSIDDVIGAIRNFSVLTPQSAPIDGKMVPNGVFGLWNSFNLALSGWNQIPVIAELGTLYGVGNFSFNTHIDRYRGNYSTAEVARILQARGLIHNAEDNAEVKAYKAQHPQMFNAVDDSIGKSMTRGTLPPDPSGRLTIKWSVLDSLGLTRDPANKNTTDVANAAIWRPGRDFSFSNTSNSLKTWHDYVAVDNSQKMELNRAIDGSFTDQSDGGRRLAIYGTTAQILNQKPNFAIKNFFNKLAGNGDLPIDRDVTQDYLNSGLSTINISATASKASGNVGLNGKPAVVPLSELDADPGDLIAGSTNRYANIIHINGTALDGSSFLKTGDIPLTQTVNGALINNTSTNVPQLPANFAFPLRGSVVSRELKKGNTVEVQYRADELGTDGQVAVAGKWAAIPGDNAKLTVSDTSITTYQTTLSGLGLTDGKTYTVHFRTIDGYGFAREAAKSTTLTVGQAPGYQIRYVLGNGANVPGTSPKFVSATGNALTIKVSDLLSTAPAGYTLTKVLKDGAAVTTTTLTLNPQVNSVISLVFSEL